MYINKIQKIMHKFKNIQIVEVKKNKGKVKEEIY